MLKTNYIIRNYTIKIAFTQQFYCEFPEQEFHNQSQKS